jgi:hypothetical protein
MHTLASNIHDLKLLRKDEENKLFQYKHLKQFYIRMLRINFMKLNSYSVFCFDFKIIYLEILLLVFFKPRYLDLKEENLKKKDYLSLIDFYLLNIKLRYLSFSNYLPALIIS